METGDPQITAAIINSTAIIIGAIIGGIFLIIAALVPFIFRKCELPTPETQADDSNGEKNGKKIKTIRIFFACIGVIFALLSLIMTIIFFITKPASVIVGKNINLPPITNIENIGASKNLNFRNWYPWNNDLITVRNGNIVTFTGNVDVNGYVSEHLRVWLYL